MSYSTLSASLPAGNKPTRPAEISVAIEPWAQYADELMEKLGEQAIAEQCTTDMGLQSFVRRVGGTIDPETGEFKVQPLDPSLPYWILGSKEMSCRTWKDSRVSTGGWAAALKLGVARRIHARRREQAVENASAWRSVATLLSNTELLKQVVELEKFAFEMLESELVEIESREAAQLSA